MRTKVTSRLSLLFLSFALVLAIPAMALADTLTVSNTLITNTDTSKAPGDTGTANVWLDVTNGDPINDRNGCNAATGSPATVTLSSTNAAISFPNGASADLTDCGSDNAKQIAYKVANNAEAGQAVITGAVTGGKDNSLYNTNDAFTVTILAPAKQNTAVSNVSGSGTYGGSADLTATLKTAAGTALSGKSVTFTLNGNSVGSANTDASGVATKSVSLSGIDAGTYTNYVSANFAGDTSNNGSTASGDLSVAKANGSVSINNIPSNATFGGSFTPTYAKAGDGTASTSSNTTGVCSVSSTGVVNFDAAGTCKLQASVAEGTNHLAASGSEQSFEIAKAPATLTFASGTLSKTYNGSAQGVQVNTDPAGLNTVTVNYFNKLADGSKGSQLSGAPTNAGSYIVEASLTNNNYQATAISGTLVIDKSATATTVSCGAGPFTYNGSAQEPCSASVKGAGGLDQSLAVGYENNVNAGQATASASYAGSGNYLASNDSKNFQIAKAATTTTVSCGAGPFTYNGAAHEPCSASVSGAGGLNQPLAVDYSNNVNAGQATASASYAGSVNHLGSSDSKNFTIDKATAQVTLGNLGPHVYDGTAKAARISTNPAGLNVSVTYNGSATAPTAVGSYNVVATVNEANYQGQATGTLVISPWTLKGFYNPVDMGGIVNTVKGGSTVPMKFEVFQGATELKDVSAIKSTQVFNSTVCGGAQTDEIELTTTGSTSLRFDATSDQFIYNWKSPTGAGCYKVVTTTQDGSQLIAYFKTR